MKTNFTIAMIALAMNVFGQLPTNGLVGYWPFNGNANDVSGNGNNGSVVGATLTDDRLGNPNSAYSFSGNYIQCAHSASLVLPSALTIGAWVKPYNSSQIGIIAQKTYSLICYSGVWLGDCWGGVSPMNVSASSSVQTNQWAFVVYTYSGTTMSIYVNGQLSGAKASAGSLQTSTEPLRFGANSWGPGEYFHGAIDEIFIYNRALTTEEIAAVYSQNVTGVLPPANTKILKVYPNPASNHITIDYGNYSLMKGNTLRIINSLGATVFKTTVKQQTSNVDLNGWDEKGIYFVHLIDAQSKTIDIRKIVIQ